MNKPTTPVLVAAGGSAVGAQRTATVAPTLGGAHAAPAVATPGDCPSPRSPGAEALAAANAQFDAAADHLTRRGMRQTSVAH
jgi:hypothetical protein